MNWKTKAIVQKVVASLPGKLSYPLYYHIQRSFGTLKSINAYAYVNGVAETLERIIRNGGTVQDKVFLEIGTGRRVTFQLLCGCVGQEKSLRWTYIRMYVLNL